MFALHAVAEAESLTAFGFIEGAGPPLDMQAGIRTESRSTERPAGKRRICSSSFRARALSG